MDIFCKGLHATVKVVHRTRWAVCHSERKLLKNISCLWWSQKALLKLFIAPKNNFFRLRTKLIFRVHIEAFIDLLSGWTQTNISATMSKKSFLICFIEWQRMTMQIRIFHRGCYPVIKIRNTNPEKWPPKCCGFNQKG